MYLLTLLVVWLAFLQWYAIHCDILSTIPWIYPPRHQFEFPWKRAMDICDIAYTRHNKFWCPMYMRFHLFCILWYKSMHTFWFEMGTLSTLPTLWEDNPPVTKGQQCAPLMFHCIYYQTKSRNASDLWRQDCDIMSMCLLNARKNIKCGTIKGTSTIVSDLY